MHFYECLKKNAEKSDGVFKGFKGGLFEHTKTFFQQNILNFFSNQIFFNSNLFQFKSFFTKICR